ncbi:MAG: protein translocase subunit SecF [Candidatus Limnocylindrales bacterium]
MFDVIGKRNWFFLFSGLILVPGFIFILLTPISNGQVGLKFSVDYTGGTVWQIQFKNQNASLDEVKAILVKDGITDAEVSQDTANNITIRTKRSDLLPQITAAPTVNPSASASAKTAASASAAAASASASAAAASASASAAAAPTASPGASASPSASPSPSPSPSPSASPTAVPTPVPNSVAQNGKVCQLHLPDSGTLAKIAADMQADPKLGPIACTLEQTTVGPIVSAELIQDAVKLVLLGSLGILIWVGIRFGSIKFGATALAALVHDVIVVVGIFAILGTLFGVQIDALFVTAMLTVIGFSVHDTIVVYDRIRENKARHAGEPFDQIVNHSILQTFGRSINTSLTVVVTLVALLLFAGASIHYFVLALLIGIISGTYSSIFNASPLLVVWQLWEDRRRAERLAAMRSGRRA